MERRAEVLTSPITGKLYVQVYTPTGRRSGEPIEITGSFCAMVVSLIREAEGRRYAIRETLTVTGQTCVKRITIGILSEEVVNEEPARFVPSHE